MYFLKYILVEANTGTPLIYWLLMVWHLLYSKQNYKRKLEIPVNAKLVYRATTYGTVCSTHSLGLDKYL